MKFTEVVSWLTSAFVGGTMESQSGIAKSSWSSWPCCCVVLRRKGPALTKGCPGWLTLWAGSVCLDVVWQSAMTVMLPNSGVPGWPLQWVLWAAMGWAEGLLVQGCCMGQVRRAKTDVSIQGSDLRLWLHNWSRIVPESWLHPRLSAWLHGRQWWAYMGQPLHKDPELLCCGSEPLLHHSLRGHWGACIVLYF